MAAKGFKQNYLMLAILLIALGIYGAMTSFKLYERWELHTGQARKWRKQIAELHHDARIEELKKEAKEEHKLEYPIFQKIKLYQLWIIFHFLIVIIGVVSLIFIIKG